MAHCGRAAAQAHRQEMQAGRKEERLHNRAMNQALRGNFGRAANLEARASNQHHRAENAHNRGVMATAGMVTGHHHHPPHCHGYNPPLIVTTVPRPGPPQPGYTVTQTTYTTGPVHPPPAYPAPPAYPTGNIPPPYPPQHAGGYYPSQPQYPGYPS